MIRFPCPSLVWWCQRTVIPAGARRWEIGCVTAIATAGGRAGQVEYTAFEVVDGRWRVWETAVSFAWCRLAKVKPRVGDFMELWYDPMAPNPLASVHRPGRGVWHVRIIGRSLCFVSPVRPPAGP